MGRMTDDEYKRIENLPRRAIDDQTWAEWCNETKRRQDEANTCQRCGQVREVTPFKWATRVRCGCGEVHNEHEAAVAVYGGMAQMGVIVKNE